MFPHLSVVSTEVDILHKDAALVRVISVGGITVLTRIFLGAIQLAVFLFFACQSGQS